MADDKREFFKRGQKPKEAASQEIVDTVEAVAENFTHAQAAEKEVLTPEASSVSLENTQQDATSAHISGEAIHVEPQHNESPVEEKIHALVEAANIPKVDGWEHDISKAPTDGSRVMISEDGAGKGVLVFWRISKFVDRKNLRYVAKGRWTDFLSKIDVTFVPKYWKLYNAEEYWPLQETK